MSTPAALDHTLVGNAGKPVVLYLHGFLGCRDDWDDVTERVGDRFSHLTVDLPGHRMSAAALPQERYTMSGCAELVIGLLDRLRIDRCHLVAYSMGGRLGLYLLAHYRERFERAVIESASPGLKTEDERTARRRHDELVIGRLMTQPFDQFLADWYRQPLFATPDRSDPCLTAMFERRRGHDPAALALSLRQMGTGAQPSLWPCLADLKPSVLFVVGEKDAKFRAIADEMANLCPGAGTAIIPGAGHNAHLERPAEFCREITQFLSPDE